MSGSVVEHARAKINLALHVLGRRTDGYHELDSIVAFADVADVLTIENAPRTRLRVVGPFANDVPAGEDNIVVKAVHALRTHVRTIPPVAITLEKNLPVASGIGGGSADAAAALRGLLRWSHTSLPVADLHELALTLGADVPVCIAQRACRMRGVGEKIEATGALPSSAIVLANPLHPCSTEAVFKALGLAPGASHGIALDPTRPEQWRNDLETPARSVLPVISEVLSAMAREVGFSAVRMSGSGATCFGLASSFDAAEQAAAVLRSSHPGWWIVAAKLEQPTVS